MGIGIYIMCNEMMRLGGIYEIDTSMCVQTLFSLINFCGKWTGHLLHIFDSKCTLRYLC